ncbi:flagellar biosynthetic protein FliO [Povalibacter uvarum]|uniref:flagellar biosynthetic protein FliO n=1 Tax=Povalibacter uvarum TaxID=732238 RepID=UPI001610833D|nr:flagellar biosynthetic protein FliO [Povalibacter uvarum]
MTLVTKGAARVGRSVLAFMTVVASATVIASAALAADQPFAAPQAVERAAPVGAGSLLQVTFSLLLVLGAVFAAAWLVRRLRGLGGPGTEAIRVVAATALGAKERAVLVQVGKQQLLLGVTPGQVSLLHTLNESIDVNAPRGNDAGDAALKPEFKAILKRSLGLK